jgi:hypothetical protein
MHEALWCDGVNIDNRIVFRRIKQEMDFFFDIRVFKLGSFYGLDARPFSVFGDLLGSRIPLASRRSLVQIYATGRSSGESFTVLINQVTRTKEREETLAVISAAVKHNTGQNVR